MKIKNQTPIWSSLIGGFGGKLVDPAAEARCGLRIRDNTPLVIEIDLHHYDNLVKRCDPWSRCFSILKNGVIIRRRKEGRLERVVQMQCTTEEAKGLLTVARHIYPNAAPEIAKFLL